MNSENTSLSINEIAEMIPTRLLVTPIPYYKLKLVIMLTMAEAQNDAHAFWLFENEWVATVTGQRR